jgi:hypothetical protein
VRSFERLGDQFADARLLLPVDPEAIYESKYGIVLWDVFVF